jgi:hypothetical protein
MFHSGAQGKMQVRIWKFVSRAYFHPIVVMDNSQALVAIHDIAQSHLDVPQITIF